MRMRNRKGNKMKKWLTLFIMICAITMLFALTVNGADIRPSVTLEDGTKITPINDVIFLPAHADVTKLQLNCSTIFKNITLNGKSVKNGDIIDISSFARTDKDTRVTYYEVIFVTENTKTPEDVVLFYKGNSLPTLHITTSKGTASLIGNTPDEGATVEIIDTQNRLMFGSYCEVRTRGNSTDTYAKKPFQIKFSSGINLMGMGKAKTWLLLANYLDQSYIRNNIMYKLAKDMGMGACDFVNVDVFIDGKYQGVYTLCEKININKNRVAISELEKENDRLNPEYSTKTTTVTSGTLIDETVISEYKYVNDIVNPADITGGYLIELDNNNKESRNGFESYFMTSTEFGENLYVIKSPENCSKEQVEYIARLFGEMEEAMASENGKNSLGKHYSEYIDLDSFAVAYIMAELGRNYDAGSASIYFNKDRDQNGNAAKIVKGPLWDCDNTLGNIHRNDAENQGNMWAKNRTPWNMLTRHSDFNTLVTQKFEIAYDIIYDMLDAGGFIDDQIAEIGFSAEIDRIRWNQADNTQWPLYEDGSLHWFQHTANAFPTYSLYSGHVNNTNDTAIGYLCKTLATRTEYLATEWGCNVTPRQRTLNTPLPPIVEEPRPNTPIVPNPPIDSETESEIASEFETEPQVPNNGVQEPQNDYSKMERAIIAISIVVGVILIVALVLGYKSMIKKLK